MKLTAKHKKAMLRGREKITSGLVLKIDEEVSIFADKYQYILSFNNKNTYYCCLEDVFSELFELKIKEELIKNEKKDIEEIIKIHQKMEKYLKNIFSKIENPAFTR